MVEGYVLVTSILRPSNQVILPCMPVSSVETRELEDEWTSVDESPVKHCRLRPPSPVQSSPFLLSLVPCCCLPCCSLCACSFFLRVFCHCVGSSLSSFDPLGLQPSLLADPRRDLSSSALSCPCLSSSCLWSCCLVGSNPCARLLALTFGRCLSLPLKFPSPSVARVPPCLSWLIHACLRCWSVGGLGGGCGSGIPCLVKLLLLAPCH